MAKKTYVISGNGKSIYEMPEVFISGSVVSQTAGYTAKGSIAVASDGTEKYIVTIKPKVPTGTQVSLRYEVEDKRPVLEKIEANALKENISNEALKEILNLLGTLLETVSNQQKIINTKVAKVDLDASIIPLREEIQLLKAMLNAKNKK